MANNLPESAHSALREREPAAVEAIPQHVDVEQEDYSSPGDIYFAKNAFEIYPIYRLITPFLTSVFIAVPLWAISLSSVGYVSLDQVVSLSLPVELFRAGSGSGNIGYNVYALFASSLSIGGAFSSYIWYQVGTHPVPIESYYTWESLVYTLIFSAVIFGGATILGPFLMVFLFLVIAVLAVLSLIAVPYSLYVKEYSFALTGLAAIGGFVFFVWFTNTYWVEQSPVLAMTYVFAVLCLPSVPLAGVSYSMPFEELGEREFLYRYIANKRKLVINGGETQGFDTEFENVPGRTYDESISRDDFSMVIELLLDIESASEGLKKIEESVEANDFEAAKQELLNLEPIIETFSPVKLNEAVFIDGTTAVESIRTYTTNLRRKHNQFKERLRIDENKQSEFNGDLSTIGTNLDEIEKLLETDQLEHCKQLLLEVEPVINQIDAEIQEYDTHFSRINKRLRSVKSRYDSLFSKHQKRRALRNLTVEQIKSAESRLTEIDSLIHDGSLEEAEEAVSSVDSEISYHRMTVESHRFVGLFGRLAKLSEQKDAKNDQIKSHQLDRVRELREVAESTVKDATNSDATKDEKLKIYARGIDFLEDAEEIASRYDQELTDAITDQMSDLVQARANVEMSLLGTELASVSGPDSASELANDGEYQEAISEIRSILQRVRKVNTSRRDDLSLIEEEAIQKLEHMQIAREKYRAGTAMSQFRKGDHTESRGTFEIVAQNLRQLVDDEEETTNGRTSKIEAMADRCDQNARIARKAALGLADESELVGIDDQARDVPAQNVGAAQDESSDMDSGLRENASAVTPYGQFGYDDFEKGDKIGSGGNADVYRATLNHGGSKEHIAVKEPRMYGTVSAQVIDSFAAEAATWSKLDSHEHILSVLAYGSSPIPWIAIEYVSQGDLSDVQIQLNGDQRIRVAAQVADGVWHAHQRGIAHLDLKPQNILVEAKNEGKNVTAKVTDWGLSKMLLDDSASIEGLSPHYSAPEQFDSETFGNSDNQTDIFQLGTVFYELFTGEQPFQGSITEVMHGIMNETPDPPSNHTQNLPDGTDEVLLKALSKQKSDRYSAVVNFRDDLSGLLE
jgi:soluble cytochrome b562